MSKKMKTALQLYSVRDFAAADFIDTLRKVKEMGYDGVEFAGLFGHPPEEVNKTAYELGLTPISAHVPINELSENTDACVGKYKTIGCEYIAIPWMDKALLPGQPDYDRTKNVITAVAAECQKQGITLLYHNHEFEFEKHDGEYLLDILFKDIPALQTEIDTCWVNVAGEDPVAYIKKYAGRAPVVHLKDFLMKGQKPSHFYELIGADANENAEAGGFEFRPLGYGQQNIPALLAAAAISGAKWVVVEQDNTSMGKTPFECARLSIEYLKTL